MFLADWNTWYKSISTVNYALHYIPDVQGLTAIKKDNYLAEAYFYVLSVISTLPEYGGTFHWWKNRLYLWLM